MRCVLVTTGKLKIMFDFPFTTSPSSFSKESYHCDRCLSFRGLWWGLLSLPPPQILGWISWLMQQDVSAPPRGLLYSVQVLHFHGPWERVRREIHKLRSGIDAECPR